jgi:VanZ family protein
VPVATTDTPAQGFDRGEVWKTWLAAALWLGLIAFESTDWLSSAHTGSLLYAWAVRLFGPINPISFDIFHHYLRKTGHVFGYAMLSFLFFRAWRATLPVINVTPWSLRWAIIAWCSTAVVASLDEWHQTFLPSRTGRIQDVFLDSAAALALQVLLWLILRGRTSRVPREQE